MSPKLELVHFQLTSACNLRCPFCGQTHGPAKSDVDWFNLLEQLKEIAPHCCIFFWGGEPLLAPGFDQLAKRTKDAGFSLKIVTNGTLIHQHAEILRECFDEIYVSIDGPEAIHDKIRGQGVFAKVRNNLKLLRGGNARVILMSVLTPESMPLVQAAPYGLAADRVILHELIAFTADERRRIPGADCWPEIPAGYPELLKKTLADLKNVKFPVPVEFQPHFAGRVPCREPYRHLHVHHDGETGFCTDFTGDSLGSVLRQSLKEIFYGEKAEEFRRRGETIFCAHCSWKNAPSTVVKLSP